MYVHIGGNTVILFSDIITILNKKTFELNQENFLLKQSVANEADFKEGLYKSVIITADQIYLSPFHTETIKRRMQVKKNRA